MQAIFTALIHAGTTPYIRVSHQSCASAAVVAIEL